MSEESNVKETKLKGAFIVAPKVFEDERGFFAPSWSLKDLPEEIYPRIVESNITYNPRKGTLRGMHYQAAPRGQAKIVRCTRGAVYDVIIDLRPDSPTFKQWLGVELTAENRLTLCVPKEFAHGYQTMTDDSELFYVVSDYYSGEHAAGVRWDDPAFGIVWPEAPDRIIIKRDREYADFTL
ncbi:MAG TPA: dTDP-4-dehydrorhamnose 3,5-epimerase [Pyrinomonadaceae bacterium]|nr:dTDP-4-dehydrorhamnose 3,5-epimerase [Pyrinomonadaceae bacterium]